LPLLDAPDEFDEIGNDIRSSIYSGVISGMMFEIDGYVLAHPENICVFTGGDAIYFAKRRKNSIFVVCNLVLMGLALIALEYDQKDK
jgi:type III pantothenate kinase